jgi:hypothetical protein
VGRNTLYVPALECASIFCDGCNSYDRDLSEEIQVCTAQIITGLTSRNSLYLETVFQPLISRRKTAKLVTMFKIHGEVSQINL